MENDEPLTCLECGRTLRPEGGGPPSAEALYTHVLAGEYREIDRTKLLDRATGAVRVPTLVPTSGSGIRH
jgi:hypothetical protein